jgi:hypothetical protein
MTSYEQMWDTWADGEAEAFRQSAWAEQNRRKAAERHREDLARRQETEWRRATIRVAAQTRHLSV